MFSHAIVKTPCTAMVHGITGHPELGAPDYEKALELYEKSANYGLEEAKAKLEELKSIISK